MNDCISRQAVIDIIHLFFTEEVDKIPTKKTEDGEVYIIRKCQPLFEMNKAICKRIKALPPVNPQEPRWIPVSEKLPETDDDVLVYDGVDMFVAWYSLKGMGQGWNSSDNNFERDTPIIAWMPLPKPYEPQESEDV